MNYPAWMLKNWWVMHLLLEFTTHDFSAILDFFNLLILLAHPAGIEPATLGFGVRINLIKLASSGYKSLHLKALLFLPNYT